MTATTNSHVPFPYTNQLGQTVDLSVLSALSAEVDLLDALRVIGARLPDADGALRLFAADCAEMVLHLYERDYPEDLRPRRTIEVARGFALGVVTSKELEAAWAAAAAATGDATGEAPRTAAWAAAWTCADAPAWTCARACARACGEAVARYLLARYCLQDIPVPSPLAAPERHTQPEQRHYAQDT